MATPSRRLRFVALSGPASPDGSLPESRFRYMAVGHPALIDEEQLASVRESIHLRADGSTILIRPDPSRMGLAADDCRYWYRRSRSSLY